MISVKRTQTQSNILHVTFAINQVGLNGQMSFRISLHAESVQIHLYRESIHSEEITICVYLEPAEMGRIQQRIQFESIESGNGLNDLDKCQICPV